MQRIFMILLVLSLLPATAWAHESETVSRPELIKALRGMSRELRRARLKVDDRLVPDERAALAEINDAHVRLISGDPAQAATELIHLLSRPGIEDRHAFADALEVLSDAFDALGLRRAAARHAREALDQPRQLPTAYARRFSKYLRLAKKAHRKRSRRYWRRLRRMQPDGPESKAFQQARYEYGRAMFLRGSLSTSEGLFESVEPGDPYYLRAKYFLGVIHLTDEDEVQAREAFEAALAAHQILSPPPLGDPETIVEVEIKGPAREIIDLEVSPEELEGDEAQQHLRRMRAVIHLALARMAAGRGDEEEAWAHYRHIPRGDPDHVEALTETAFVLYRTGDFGGCARTIDQLLQVRPEDGKSAKLALWQGELQARADDHIKAAATFNTLQTRFQAHLDAFDKAVDATQTVFSKPVVHWGAPESAKQAQVLEALVLSQEAAINEAQGLLLALERAADSDDLLPTVKLGRAILADMKHRMRHFSDQLIDAESHAHRHGDKGSKGLHGGGAPANLKDIDQLTQSFERLQARLGRYKARLDKFDRRYRKRIYQVAKLERPRVAALEKRLKSLRARMNTVGDDMRVEARENLDNYVARAFFGKVDISFWRKEAVSSQIEAVIQEQQDAMEPFKDIERDMDENGRFPFESQKKAVPAPEVESAPVAPKKTAPAPEKTAPAPEKTVEATTAAASPPKN